MRIKPVAEWFKAKGFAGVMRLASKKRTSPIRLIVIHATAGSSLEGALVTLLRRGFSYHYIIDRDGTVHKCVPTSRVAHHAGNSYGPMEEINRVSSIQDRNHKFIAGTSVNGYSVGISLVSQQRNAEDYTVNQVAALKDLIRELRRGYGTIQWCTTHAAVSPRRKVDPRHFHFTATLGAFLKQLGIAPWGKVD